jgi:hypothetical protein
MVSLKAADKKSQGLCGEAFIGAADDFSIIDIVAADAEC